jgi:hypothetical protein
MERRLIVLISDNEKRGMKRGDGIVCPELD